MRLKKEVLKNYCKGPISRVMYLNLSNLDIDVIERLNKCDFLHWFIARNNNFQSDDGIEFVKQLWYLDLSNNKIENLSSLNRFLALGTLILSNNNLKWQDLQRISHVHLMSLSLHGNPQLDSDPYYRIHVIDSLPLIWELDGRIVTVTERLHVKQFFVDTQYTQHPVRHKVSKPFQTSALKNIGNEGVVSEQCKYIFSKFPVSEAHTKNTDERRLKYLTKMVQQDINRFMFELGFKSKLSDNFLLALMEERAKDVERCNMILLLLVISLEFQLPTALVRAALVNSQLDMMGAVSTMPIFLLPREFRTKVIGILLNAAKLDRDNNMKHEGGLYAQLFMCLYYTVAQLTKISQTSHNNLQKIKPIPHNADYMALMTSEVVSLLLKCTQFYNLITTEHGVVALISAATGNIDVVFKAKEKIHEYFQGLVEQSIQEIYDNINTMILHAIEERINKINIKMADIPVGDRYLALSDSLPIKPLHSVIWASNFLSSGQIIPRTSPPILHPEREAAKPKPLQPKMGEKVLLGPQVVGELTMLMGGDIAMVKIDAVPVANGAVVSKLKSTDAHFAFVDMKGMCYGHDIHMWRPLKTVGDKAIEEPRYTIHSTDSKTSLGYKQTATTHKVDAEPSPLIYTPRDKQKTQQVRESSSKSEGSAKGQKNYTHNSKNSINMNFSFSNREFEELFPEEEPNRIRPLSSIAISASTNVVETDSKKVPCTVINCASLHENDDVHYIKGFTPREDSSRSCSISATPSDRTKSNIPTATSEKKEIFSNDSAENQAGEKETSRKGIIQEQGNKDNELNGKLNSQLSAQELESFLSSPGKDNHSHIGQEVKDVESMTGTGPNLDDNCPICIAKRQGTIYKAINGQLDPLPLESGMEPLDNQISSNKPLIAAKVETIDNEISSNKQLVAAKVETIDNQTSSNKQLEAAKIESATHEDKVDEGDQENQEPVANRVPELKSRPKSSIPFGGVRLRSSDRETQPPHQQAARPKSAMESYSYYVITNPPNVSAMGTKAQMNERFNQNAQSIFKTDFQQQREEAWKRTTRSRRPQTAAVMTSSHMPPPQRPSSPIMRRELMPKTSRMKVTRTDRWLGGGRDLYWESVRKRPKSGHVPGWKEGLPESMKNKRRPMTAHSVPLTRVNMSRPGSTTFVSSCSNCSPTPYGYPPNGQAAFTTREEEDGLFLIPQSLPASHPMGMPTRVVTTPEMDEEEQTFLLKAIPKEKGLCVQGIPPYTIPHPRKFSYLPSNEEFLMESELPPDYYLWKEYNPYHHPTMREEPMANTAGHYSGDNCPPPSPRDESGLCETDRPDLEEIIKISNIHSNASKEYKLCSHHEKMFRKEDGNVVIYVIDAEALEHLNVF